MDGLPLFEWDETKRLITLTKHGIDFIDAVEIFLSDHVLLPGKGLNEERSIAVGLLQGVAIAVVFTLRGDVIRVITARRARRDERRSYEAHVSGGHPQGPGADGLGPGQGSAGA